MGIDMRTFGGMVSFTAYSKQAVEKVKAILDESGYLQSTEHYRIADYTAAKNWYELFMEFKQFLIPAGRSNYILLGYDDRHYPIKPLFDALAAAELLEEGSWIATTADTQNSYEFLVLENGVLRREESLVNEDDSELSREEQRQKAAATLDKMGINHLPLEGELPFWALGDEALFSSYRWKMLQKFEKSTN